MKAPENTQDGRRAFLLPLLIGLGLLVWFVIVAERIYNFSPAALEYALTQTEYMGRIFSGLPANTTSLVLLLSFAFSAIFPGYVLTAAAKVDWSSAFERLVFSLGVGLIFYTFVFMALGSMGWLTAGPLFGITVLCGVGSFPIVVRIFAFERRENGLNDRTFSIPSRATGIDICLGFVLAALLFLALLGGLNYETRFDAMWYHLAEARRWALDGRLVDLLARNRSLTAGLPHYQEILYAGIMPMFGLAASKLLAWFDLLLAVFGIIVFTSYFFGSRTWGLLASIVFTSTPIVSFSAGTASNDLPLASMTILSGYAVLRWREAPQAYGWLAIAGVLSGYETGVKTTGFFTVFSCTAVLIAVTIYGAMRRSNRLERIAEVRAGAIGLAVFCALAVASSAPGLLQIAAWTRDPFFPIFASVFKSPYNLAYLNVGSDWFSQYFRDLPSHAAYLLTFPWGITFQNNSVIGPIFLTLAPLAIVTMIVSRKYRNIAVLVSLFCFTWAALFNITPTLWFRYAEALAPFISILAVYPLFVLGGRSAAWITTKSVACVLLAAMVLLNTPPAIPSQIKAAIPGDEGGTSLDWNYLYKNGPPAVPAPAPQSLAITYLNASLPRDSRVYDNAELFIYTLYVDPEMYEPSPDPAAWTLYSPGAFEQLRKNHVQYIVTYLRDQPKLRESGLSAHLHEIMRFPDDAAKNDDTVIVLSHLR